MAERHRLRDLQLRITGHDRVRVLFGEIEQRAAERSQLGRQVVDRRAKPQAEIGGDLIIARARRVQALAGNAHQCRQAPFDIEVNVFERAREFELAALDLALNLREAGFNRAEIVGGDDLRVREHARMRPRRDDVDFRQAPIEIDRRVEALHARRHGFRESAGPSAAGRQRTGGRRRFGGNVVFWGRCGGHVAIVAVRGLQRECRVPRISYGLPTHRQA